MNRGLINSRSVGKRAIKQDDMSNKSFFWFSKIIVAYSLINLVKIDAEVMFMNVTFPTTEIGSATHFIVLLIMKKMHLKFKKERSYVLANKLETLCLSL